MNKSFIKLITVVILASTIFMGCSDKRDSDIGDKLTTEDMEYVKSIEKIDESNGNHYTLFYSTVIEDRGDLSVLESVFDDEYNMENGHQSGVFFIDTEGIIDLKMGDCVLVNIETSSNAEWTGFELLNGPMNQDELKEYAEKEDSIRREAEENERKEREEYEKEVEEYDKKEGEENAKIAGEIVGDTRKKEETKDEDTYLITSTNKLIFIPAFTQGEYMSIAETVRTNKRVESEEELGNIIGEYQAKVVLTSPGKSVVAVNKEGVFKYYALRTMKDYKIGDNITIIEGDQGVQSFFIVGD